MLFDEAAQASELATLIPLQYGAKRVILVGDPQQLPATVVSLEAKRRGVPMFMSMFMSSAHVQRR